MADRAAVKWWGWGDPDRAVVLPGPAVERLRQALGGVDRMSAPVPLEAVELDEPQFGRGVHERLCAVVGSDHVRQDRLTRVAHAAGKGYVDLVRIRSGDARGAPDAVVYPNDAGQVRALLELSADRRVAVVPFGGGTSVVGGVEPVRDSFDSLITLDLGRMAEVLDLDSRSLTARMGPGLRGPQVEASLARSGLTLGHFPQSYECATVGGWVATRSAGQASTGFGKIEEMVAGLELVSPAGEIRLPALPASAAGPELRDLLVGSEGVLGVITEATLRVRPLPEERHYEGWMLDGFAEGADVLRRLEQDGIAPEVARLSDEVETGLSMALGADRSRVGKAYLRARGLSAGCLAVMGFEGGRASVARRRAQVARVMRSKGALRLGTRAGRAWERDRFAAPYLRDALLDRCIMVETLETATEWSGLMKLYEAVRGAVTAALAARGTPPLVMCHISHLYPDGASLYFTLIAAQEEGSELEQWRAAKHAACDAILSAGGTITHHHAVGRDHAPWLAREVGPLGVEVVRAMKAKLDPAGVMNPGKLLPPGGGGKAGP